ncbi:MAG TPA: zf-HC2 domain-containing protein [Thermoanaerobaculia bacterium]|nr:zf-HC2 domain-containing protein [Thermoanaerobaculia bacterium]
MSSLAPHPARSVDFLSRLTDGELTAAERAQFESHRAHCAECRRAASEFESALALFRSSRPRPAATDLSARILRKLQAGNRRRSSFGVTFGIDLRWAGAFAAALLAVLIGSTVVVRREAAERRLARESAPIPVSMERDRSIDKTAKDQLQAPAPAAPQQRAAGAAEPAREGALEKGETVHAYANSDTLKSSSVDEKLPASNALAKEKPQDKPEKEALRRDTDSRMDEAKPSESKFEAQARSRQESAPRPAAAAAAPGRGAAPPPAVVAGRVGERAGGEGGNLVDGVSDSSAARPSLKIVAGDDWGSVPVVVNAADVDLPPDLRGREFVLVVEASGRVRDVRAAEKHSTRKKIASRDEERGQGAVLEEKANKGFESLRSLRFAPGDRPRRLLVHVE